MKTTALIVGLCICTTPVASSQASAQAAQTVTKYVTIDGDVVRYEPGRVIVIRGADNREILYNLSPNLSTPSNLQVGRRVTLYTEPGIDGGTQVVSRVTITTLTPEGNVKRITEDTRTLPSGETTRTTYTGDVVRYEPGRTIVLRGTDNKEMLYALSPSVVMPTDVQVGRRVTLYTEPGRDGGTQMVSRVTTTSVTPEGNVKRTTEDTRTLPSGATTTTTTTEISGRVSAFSPGKTLTITRADGTQATYIITESSRVPADLVVGKNISIVPSATGELMIQTVTYVKPQR